jgi:hypothetical protein
LSQFHDFHASGFGPVCHRTRFSTTSLYDSFVRMELKPSSTLARERYATPLLRAGFQVFDVEFEEQFLLKEKRLLYNSATLGLCMPSLSQIVGALCLMAMAAIFDILNRAPQWFAFTRSNLRRRQWVPGLAFSLFLGCGIGGFQMSNNCNIAAVFFVVAGVSGAVVISELLRVLARIPRIIYTVAATVPLAIFLVSAYKITCPILTIWPQDEVTLNKGDQVTFRVSNKSRDDVWAATFLFQLNSLLCSAADFDVKVRTSKLSAQQSSEISSVKFGDVYGVTGIETTENLPYILVYVWDLTPGESRELIFKFNGVGRMANPKVNLLPRIMSYSTKETLTHKDENNVVSFPMIVDEVLTVKRALLCFPNKDDDAIVPCVPRDIEPEGIIKPAPSGYFYWIAFVTGRTLPDQIQTGQGFAK